MKRLLLSFAVSLSLVFGVHRADAQEIKILGTGTEALLGGDLTDPEDDGDETVDTTVEGWPADGNWNFVNLTASDKEHFSDPAVNPNPREGAFDIFDNSVGSLHNKWCCGGPPLQATVEFADAVSLTHFTITSGNDTPARDPLEWEIQGSNTGEEESFETIFRQDEDEAIWEERNQVALVTLPAPSAAYRFIRYAVMATGNGHQINEIEYFGDADVSFEIVAFSYDRDAGTAALEWESKPGRFYAVDASIDLRDWDEIVTNLRAEGETLSYVDTDIPADQRNERYYRARQVPPPALLSEDFEDGPAGWTTETLQGDTPWELGTPNVEGLTEANSGVNAWGTDLDGDYGPSVIASLRSPIVDLTGIGSPKVSFFYFVDSIENGEGGQLRFLDEGGTELATLEQVFWGTTDGWTPFEVSIPSEAREQKIIIEFLFLSDEDAAVGAGWYIDDVVVR